MHMGRSGAFAVALVDDGYGNFLTVIDLEMGKVCAEQIVGKGRHGLKRTEIAFHRGHQVACNGKPQEPVIPRFAGKIGQDHLRNKTAVRACEMGNHPFLAGGVTRKGGHDEEGCRLPQGEISSVHLANSRSFFLKGAPA